MEGQEQLPGGFAGARGRAECHPQAGSLPTGTSRVESTGAGTDARRPTPDRGAGGQSGEKLVLDSCSCQGVKKRESEFRPQRKGKALEMGMGRAVGGIRKGAFVWQGEMPGEKVGRKLFGFSVCASDFRSQRGAKKRVTRGSYLCQYC